MDSYNKQMKEEMKLSSQGLNFRISFLKKNWLVKDHMAQCNLQETIEAVLK